MSFSVKNCLGNYLPTLPQNNYLGNSGGADCILLICPLSALISEMCNFQSGKKNSININFLVRISCGHSGPLRPDAQGSKSFSPLLGPQENALFGADVHKFLARTSMTRRVVEKLCTKKVCVNFLAPIQCLELHVGLPGELLLGRTRNEITQVTCSFCHLDFVKEFLHFGREISANLG